MSSNLPVLYKSNTEVVRRVRSAVPQRASVPEVVLPKQLRLNPPTRNVHSPQHQIIVAAVDVIHTYGFKRHRRGNTRTGFCILGALEYAANQLGLPWSEYRKAVKAVANLVPEECQTGLPVVKRRPSNLISEYNDVHAGAYGAVALLDAAAFCTP